MSEASWYHELKRRHKGNGNGNGTYDGGGEFGWAEPDMEVLRLNRRPPPVLPLTVFGRWEAWISETADAAACPPDYVVAPLLACASALIGHARWAQATPGWAEPPHLWTGSVGESGSSKSPGADALLRYVSPEIEHRMTADFSSHRGRTCEGSRTEMAAAGPSSAPEWGSATAGTCARTPGAAGTEVAAERRHDRAR